LGRQRPRDGNALALAAGEFVRITRRETRLQPDQSQQLGDTVVAPFGRHDVVQGERFGEQLLHGHARIERGVRVLKDDLHLAPERSQLLLIEGENIATVEAQLARGRLDQPQNEASDGGFAAAGFADQRQGLTGL
jgi:hypothetical protein